jgi:hypothetical protein
MDVGIKGICLTSRPYGDAKMNVDRVHLTPPMLYPANIHGTIVLPKIVSQMIQKQPLLTKYCLLDLRADHLVVDFCALNAIEVLNFTRVFPLSPTSFLTHSPIRVGWPLCCIDSGTLMS